MYRIRSDWPARPAGDSAALAQDGLDVTPDRAAGLRTAERSLRLGATDIHLDLSVGAAGQSATACTPARRLLPHRPRLRRRAGQRRAARHQRPVDRAARGHDGLAVGPPGRRPALEPLEPGTLPTDRPGAQVALPYIGLGYTSLSARERLGPVGRHRPRWPAARRTRALRRRQSDGGAVRGRAQCAAAGAGHPVRRVLRLLTRAGCRRRPATVRASQRDRPGRGRMPYKRIPTATDRERSP